MPDEVIDGLTSAGFFRLLKPPQFRGCDVSQRGLLQAIEALGQASGSAAWLVSIAATTAHFARRAPEKVQTEVFASPTLESPQLGTRNCA